MYNLSLLPIDVGFDLKEAKIPINLASTENCLSVKFLNKKGKKQTTEGTKEEVANTLQKNGYLILIENY